ncbi:MAG: zinc ribbon domain-containing protein [bacterium]
MPFFDYKCQACQKVFETVHGMAGKPADLKCEFCGSKDLLRIFHPIGRLSSGADHSHSHSSGSKCGACSSHSCGSCH